MIEHVLEFFGFKNHPILKKIEQRLQLADAGLFSLELLRNNVLFIYPKIISFSFQGYSHELPNYLVQTRRMADDKEVMLREGEQEFEFTSNKDAYLNFFRLLLNACNHLQLNAVFVIDLRAARTLDETIIRPIVDLFNNSNKKVLLFLSENTERKLVTSSLPEGYEFLFSADEFASYIEKLIMDPINILHLPLSGKLTLFSFDETLKQMDFYNKLQDAYLVFLGLQHLSNMSAFCIYFLNVLIHSVSHNYGVIWDVGLESAKTHLSRTLTCYRTFEVNKLFLRHKAISAPAKELDPKNFGIYLFDKNTWANVLGRFETYLSNLGLMFPDYLSEYVSIKYDYKFKSVRADNVFLTHYNLVSSIVSELAENVAIHADGIGYLAASVSKYRLHLFVGDSGIGLRNGILKNYELHNEIKDDHAALNFLFQLHEFRTHRRGDSDFNIGAGYGLKDALSHIFANGGKFIFRTGACIGSFMNPVQKASTPSKILDSYIWADGTQYMILIPVSHSATRELPDTTEAFLMMED